MIILYCKGFGKIIANNGKASGNLVTSTRRNAAEGFSVLFAINNNRGRKEKKQTNSVSGTQQLARSWLPKKARRYMNGFEQKQRTEGIFSD